MGSPDVYGHKEREVEHSINFVTCHDGFTLNDLVSYNDKHNEANGEDNRDGADDNRSWNCGVEGPTDDPAIEALRNRQIKNLLAINLLSAGTPMLTMGDEVRRTQQGNNNAYCQDNDISWFDWGLARASRRHPSLRPAPQLRTASAATRRADPRRQSLTQLIERARIRWSGVDLDRPDWSDHSHTLAVTLESQRGPFLLHGIFNAYWEPLDVRAAAGADELSRLAALHRHGAPVARRHLPRRRGARVSAAPATWRSRGRSSCSRWAVEPSRR